jgi:regulator of protease activity HflC (stomatin/prohibitin superfamily)
MMFGLYFVAAVALLIISGLKVLREYERAVIFRLGRLKTYRGPGLIYVIPGIERMQRIDMRTITMDVPSQDVITRDNVSVKVNAVVYFRVVEPSKGRRRGRELSLRDLAARADDAQERVRPGRARPPAR